MIGRVGGSCDQHHESGFVQRHPAKRSGGTTIIVPSLIFYLYREERAVNTDDLSDKSR
jgi:hypothetical protein